MSNELIFSNTMELFRFLPEDIVLVKADGNYSDFYIVGDGSRKMVIQLGQVEKLIHEQAGEDAPYFIRVGRSYIINTKYIYHMDLRRLELTLRDRTYKKYLLDDISGEALKKLMNVVSGKENNSNE